MRARKNKKSMFLRKSTWLLIVIFIATLITIPSFTTKAEGREETYSNTIKILDIEPGGNSFTLGDGNSRTYTDKTTSPGTTIEVTRISMAEYISMVDEIRGQYDAVVVGRSNPNNDLKTHFSYYKQYRDYTSAFSQEFTDLYVYKNDNGTVTDTLLPKVASVNKSRVYFNLPSEWSQGTPTIYVYEGSDKNAAWPGVAMTSLGNGLYYYDVPSRFSNPLVNFASSEGNKQYPESGQPGRPVTFGKILLVDGANNAFVCKEINSGVVFKKISDPNPDLNWGTPRCYIYEDGGSKNNTWPGVVMTSVGNELFYYEVPSGYTNPKVMFVDENKDSNKYPVSGNSYTYGTVLASAGSGWTSSEGSSNSEIRNKLKYFSANNDAFLRSRSFYSGYMFGTKANEVGTDWGKTFVEYYSENDITNKRAREITAMLESGEPVYFDKNVFAADMQNTNLYMIFNGKGTVFDNTDGTTDNDINIERIVDDLSLKKRRPKIDKITMSDDDSTTIDASHRNMVYKLTFNGDRDENGNPFDPSKYEATIHLDLDANGIFTESLSKVKLSNCPKTEGVNEFQLSNGLSRDFVGYLDWKIEITNTDTQMKSYITNHSIFKALPDPTNPSITKYKTINVLQIYPDAGSNLNLQTNDNFNSVSNDVEMNKYGYDLNITSISCSKFNTNIAANSEYLKNNFDMVIVGFGDSYGNGQLTSASVDAIDKFIKTDQKTAMFTHDTMTLNTFGGDGVKTYQQHSVSPIFSTDANGKYWDMGVGPKILGQKLRDYLGQSRYVDNYRGLDANGKNVEADLNSSIKIKHDDLNPVGNSAYTTAKANKQLYSMGATLYMNEWSSATASSVRTVNKAQINSYPYGLDDQITVATTHTQWYQLNLEDEEITPWYNLNGNSNLDSGDSRNNYYTYSRRNITYSGTGHTSDYSEEEFKLFVNTIIKASRGANTAPTIVNKNTSGSVIPDDPTSVSSAGEVKNTETYTFHTIPNDPDCEKTKVKVTVDGKAILQDTTFFRTNEEEIIVQIDNSCFINKNDGETVRVVCTAEDSGGLTGTSSFNLTVRKAKDPIIHGVLEENETITPTKVVDYFKDINFRGEITSHSPSAVINLSVDSRLQVKSDVLINVWVGSTQKVTGGKMVLANGKYSYTLDPAVIGAIDSSGFTITVDYTAEVYSLPPVNVTSYTNTLSATNADSANAVIRTSRKTGDPDLF